MLFPETHWTLLADATLHGGQQEQEALKRFYLNYLPPVKKIIAMRGIAADRVDDVAQDFFVHLMQCSMPRRANREKGKFRTYLRTVLVNFLNALWEHDHAQKRGGGMANVSRDDPDAAITDAGEAVAPVQMEAVDREWALHLLSRAIGEVERQWSAPGDSGEFQMLRHFLLPGVDGPPPADKVCEALGCSPVAFRKKVERLRREFAITLRREVAATVSSAEELAEEFAYLGQLLRTGGMHRGT